MKDPAQLELVVKALTCGVTGCVDWEPKQAERVRLDADLRGLSPRRIALMVIDHVMNGGAVFQVEEKRPQWSHRDYYYKVIVPYPEFFTKRLFIEMELLDDDPDLPVVMLVNAHEQK